MKGHKSYCSPPPNADEKIEECFFHQVYAMKWHNIHPKVAEQSALSNLTDTL
jgi:hypothetical protein